MTAMCFWFMACAAYFPRGCRSKIMSALQQIRVDKPASLTTIIGPLYQLLAKKRPVEAVKMKGRPRSGPGDELNGASHEPGARPKRNATNDSEILGDLHQLLSDKKSDKKHKFKLQYTIRDDMFLNSCKATLLRLDQRESATSEALDLAERKDLSRLPFETKKSILHSKRKTQLSKMIESLEEELAFQVLETDNSVKKLRREIELEHNRELPFEGTYQTDYLLKDLQCRFEEEVRFLDHMEYKQHNMVISSILDTQQKKDKFIFPEKERPKKSEDYCCQVCSDGDYTESNKIVFCARCNISYHQRCYGINQIPEGNWICDLCKYYGANGRFMRCALCTRKGGCLRRTNIEARSDYWKQRNPAYYEAMISHPAIEREPPEPIEDAELGDDVSVNSKNFENFLFYDYYTELDKNRPEDVEKEPHPHLAWVHLSCCLWNTELEVHLFQPPPEKVLGFDRLEKKRFGLTCNVCGQKEGACVQCASRKCHEAFHVECARRTKVFMEAKNSENRHYTVYCDRHAPLMAKRKLDSTALSICSDITKFCRNIEKIFDTHKGKLEEKPPEEETPAFIRSLKKKKMEKTEANSFEENLLKNFFIREVKHEICKFPDFGNVITVKCNGDGLPQSAEYEPPKKVFLKSAVHKHHRVWSQLAKKNNWQLRNIYKKYKRVLQGVTENPLEGLIKTKSIRKTKVDWEATGDVFFIENTEKFDDEPYCVCRKPWRGEIMIECSKCQGWFHPLCLDIQETNEVILNQMDITCTFCLTGTRPEDKDAALGKREGLEPLDEYGDEENSDDDNHSSGGSSDDEQLLCRDSESLDEGLPNKFKLIKKIDDDIDLGFKDVDLPDEDEVDRQQIEHTALENSKSLKRPASINKVNESAMDEETLVQNEPSVCERDSSSQTPLKQKDHNTEFFTTQTLGGKTSQLEEAKSGLSSEFQPQPLTQPPLTTES